MARRKYTHGKIFRAKRGKFAGKLVKYRYTNGRANTKRMVRHYSKKRRY